MQAKNIVYLLLLLGFTSCNFLISEIDMKDYPIEQRIVLNAVIHAGCDSNLVFLNDSYPFFDENTSRQYEWKDDGYDGYWTPKNVNYLENAQSILYRNGVPNSDMHFRQWDNALFFNEKFNAGDIAKIEVTDKERKASASVVIPEKPIILQVDTFSFYEKEDDIYSMRLIPQMRLLIKIKDQPDVKNYYRINVFSTLSSEYDSDSIFNIAFISGTNSFISNDPILNNGVETGQVFDDWKITKTEKNVFNIFTDDLFQNGEYTLDLYVRDLSREYFGFSSNNNRPERRKYQIKILLQTISEDLYFYYSSFQKYDQLNDDMIEPIRVYNNIEGGLGILGAVNELEYLVADREWISE